MNENIDLTKILKDCPKWTKFYTPVWGEVSFIEVRKNENCLSPIRIYNECSNYVDLDKKGRYFNCKGDEECILFPSKEQKDWNKFSAPWYKKEKFDPKTLQPFDKVLVRDDDPCVFWRCSFYSHTWGHEIITTYRYAAMDDSYAFCIPYNDDTKHLVGTTDEAPEYYRYWEA